MAKSMLVLAVPHQLQGQEFGGYVKDSSYSKLVRNFIRDGVDFVFEEAAGRDSIAKGLANSLLGPGHYLDFDPPPDQRAQYGIAAKTSGGGPIDPFQTPEPGAPPDTFEYAIVEEQAKREELWTQRVMNQPFTKGLTICGLCHGLSVAFRFKSAGVEVADSYIYIPYHKVCSRPHVV
jgi:hypothetical protein